MSPASLVYLSSHNHGSLKKVRWDRSLTLVGLRAFNPFKKQTPPKLPPSISGESPSTLINESTELPPPQKKKRHTAHPHESPSIPVLRLLKKSTRWWGFFDAGEEDALLLALWRFHGAVTASKVFSCSEEVDLRWPPGSLWLGRVEVQQGGP